MTPMIKAMLSPAAHRPSQSLNRKPRGKGCARRARVACLLSLISLASLLSGSLLAATNTDTSTAIQAPAFDLPLIANGEGRLTLADLRGKVTYIDFWASWCGPCRLSLPALNSLQQAFAPEDFAVIAVSVDVVEEDALDFLVRYPVTYPVLIDTEGSVAKAFAVNGMPSGYLLDAQGVVHDVHVGFKRGDEAAIADAIRALLEQKAHNE